MEYKPKFVEIQPFEYQIYECDYPRLITYWGFLIDKNLTKEDLKKIIDDLNKKKPINVIENPDELLEWQYEGKPLVILSKIDNKIYTTQGTINHFGIRACQTQAANVLQILRKYGFANFTQWVVTLDPKRLGRTSEERVLTFEALERLEARYRNKSKTTTYDLAEPKKGRPKKGIDGLLKYQIKKYEDEGKDE